MEHKANMLWIPPDSTYNINQVVKSSHNEDWQFAILVEILRWYCRIGWLQMISFAILVWRYWDDIAGLVECQLQEDGEEGVGDHQEWQCLDTNILTKGETSPSIWLEIKAKYFFGESSLHWWRFWTLLSDDGATQRLVRHRGWWEKVKAEQPTTNYWKICHLFVKIRFEDICTRVPVSDPFLRRRKRDAEVRTFCWQVSSEQQVTKSQLQLYTPLKVLKGSFFFFRFYIRFIFCNWQDLHNCN